MAEIFWAQRSKTNVSKSMVNGPRPAEGAILNNSRSDFHFGAQVIWISGL